MNHRNEAVGLFELVVSLGWGLVGWNLPRWWIEQGSEAILRKDLSTVYQTVGDAVIVDFLLNKPLVEPPTVPSILLIRTAGWFPLVVALLLAFRSGRKDPSLRANNLRTTFCAWATAIGTSEALTHTFKVYVQRRRPNFIALCGFKDGTCTADRYLVTDANLSFPSGHSSLAACGMTFLTLTVASQLLLLASTTAPRLRVRWLVAATALSAFVFTIFVGTSRIVDHWHHPSDVLAGWLLGSAVSAGSFHVWYPPLWHAHVGRPWSVVLGETRATISSSSSSTLPRTTNPKLPSFHE